VKIAVVILNWNGKSLLETFLPSVVANSSTATIYVVDNASSDESIAFIKEHFPTVVIIQNPINGGYAQGYNMALSSLQEDIFILLNNDVEVSENWLIPIVEAFNNNTSLVALQPKILDYKNKEYFEYAGAAGGFIDRFGYPYCRGRIFNTLELDQGQYDNNMNLFWASGACLAVKKEAFWEVDGFDEDLFAHQEEIDLCWRMQIKGGTIGFVGQSSVYHLGGATLQASNPKKTYFNFRNTLLILYKNVKGPKIYALLLIRMALDALAGVQFLMQGKFMHIIAIIHAHFGFYKRLPLYTKKRRETASNMTYWNVRSIVWKYFVQNKRLFNKLY